MCKELGRTKIVCSLAYDEQSDDFLRPSINAQALPGAADGLVFGKWTPSTIFRDLYDTQSRDISLELLALTDNDEIVTLEHEDDWSDIYTRIKETMGEETTIIEECLTSISFDGELTFFNFKGLKTRLFGDDCASLTSLQSLFVGIFPLRTILEMDFTPFYKKTLRARPQSIAF